MYYEEPRIPALPGEENVTDGSVDDYGTDWETWTTARWKRKWQSVLPHPVMSKPPARTTTRSRRTYHRTKL